MDKNKNEISREGERVIDHKRKDRTDDLISKEDLLATLQNNGTTVPFSEYKFKHQLDFDGLENIIDEHHKLGWSEAEVSELLKNDVIVDAHIQGKTLTLSTEEIKGGINFSTIYRIRLSYGSEIKLDYSKVMETSEGYCLHPKTILAYKRVGVGKIEQVSHAGGFISWSSLEPTFLDSYIAEIKSAGGIELPTIYWGDDAGELLIEKGIRTIVK